jgi:hypothetical protein
LSDAVQAMPPMPGIWMSINTTSGGDCGITRKASSPEAQVQAQRKPGASPM